MSDHVSLPRWADRLGGRMAALDPGLVEGAKGLWLYGGRRMVCIRPRPRRRAVRVELAPGWPWPRRRALERAAVGYVVWVTDERSMRWTVALVHRTLWRLKKSSANGRRRRMDGGRVR